MSKRALVVGFGSIGGRHLNVLDRMGLDTAIVTRRGLYFDAIDPPLVWQSIEEGVARHAPDYVVIATETGSRIDHLRALAETGYDGRVLVEKPLLAAPGDLPANRFRSVHVGYQLRFHPACREWTERYLGGGADAASFDVGQHLADWRPGRDPGDIYSSSKADGGGVLRDLSHELDLALYWFGPWKRVLAAEGGRGSIKGDAEMAVTLVLECRHCPLVTIQLNALDRPARRRYRVSADKGTVEMDFSRGQSDSAFRHMHRLVLGRDSDSMASPCTLEEGLAVVDLIAAAERSIAERRWVEAP